MIDINYDLWLLPAEPLAAKLRAIIERLAKAYNSVAFEPHVTFFSGHSNKQEIIAIARKLVACGAPIELQKQSIAHSDLLSKTLFVQFAESTPLRSLHDEAVLSCACKTGYKLNPHLSLLYKRMDEADKDRLSHTVEVPEGPFLFQSLLAIETDGLFTNPAQIKNWRIVYDSRNAESCA